MKYSDYLLKENEKPLDNILNDGGFTSIFRTVACIGDSLSSGEFESLKEDGSHGYHDMYEHSWGQYLARMCGSKVYNFSRGGMTAKNYCKSFAEDNDFWNEKYASDAYIIALGVNDIICINEEVGSVEDIDTEDYTKNADNFAGYYAQIITRLKKIQPRAKFFVMTMLFDEGESEENRNKKLAHRELLYRLSEVYDNMYVLDMLQYAPILDSEYNKNFKLLGHLNPMGYLLTAKMVASYIDYIIRSNTADFKEVGFIGTDLHG